MKKHLLIICVICYSTNFCCSQVDSNKYSSKVKVEPELRDDFFKSKSYSRTPSSKSVYKNDTLILDTTYAVITEKEANAFIEDQYNKRFELSECFGIIIKDTMLIEFKSNFLEEYLLSIKIVNGYFSSSFSEINLKTNYWIPIKEKLILNTKDFKNNQEVKGIIETEFVLIDDGIKKDSILFYGPFYYKVSVPPEVRVLNK